jgi:AcrR family transcriptional regulator
MSTRTTEPRPYLRAVERRAQLLEAAATIVGREGLGCLTIAAVASEAGVSRQWVYEHFSDLDNLFRALILDRFAALDTTIDAATDLLTGTELATFAARQLFILGPADRRILRALVDGAGWNRPELAGIESELRERIFGRWTGHVRTTGHDEVHARAIVWAIVNAAFGLADQVEREALTAEQAVALLALLVSPFTTPTTPGHRTNGPPVGDHDIDQYGTGGPYAH